MRTKATSADIHSLDLSVNQNAYSLDIRLPGSLCFQVGVGYVESRLGRFAANFTIISHVLHLLALSAIATVILYHKLFSGARGKNNED